MSGRNGAEQPSGRGRDGLISVGVGLAAAGAGAALGLATDRLIGDRTRRDRDTENYGGLHGPGRVVIADDGTRLHVEVDEIDAFGPVEPSETSWPDARPTLVFCHGYALSMDTWHFQRKLLRGRYRMVFWDQRGHGRSGLGKVGHSTIDQLGHDLLDVIAAAAPSGPLVLIGHSMGGMTLMSLAAARPELIEERVIGAAFVATSCGGLSENDLGLWRFGAVIQRIAPSTLNLLNRAPWLTQHARRLISDIETQLVRRYSFASTVSPSLLKFTAAVIASTPLEAVADFMPTFATHDKCAELAVYAHLPSLVIVGDEDLLTPAEHSVRIAERLPESELVLVPDAGHILMLEHPDTVNAALENLLERVASGAAPPQAGKGKRLLRSLGSLSRRRSA